MRSRHTAMATRSASASHLVWLPGLPASAVTRCSPAADQRRSVYASGRVRMMPRGSAPAGATQRAAPAPVVDASNAVTTFTGAGATRNRHSNGPVASAASARSQTRENRTWLVHTHGCFPFASAAQMRWAKGRACGGRLATHAASPA